MIDSNLSTQDEKSADVLKSGITSKQRMLLEIEKNPPILNHTASGYASDSVLHFLTFC